MLGVGCGKCVGQVGGCGDVGLVVSWQGAGCEGAIRARPQSCLATDIRAGVLTGRFFVVTTFKPPGANLYVNHITGGLGRCPRRPEFPGSEGRPCGGGGVGKEEMG